MSVDVDFEDKYCIIPIYTPHCGYSQSEFDAFYDDFRAVASIARRAGRKIIIGGDFNTQLNVGVRSERLRQFAAELELQICNDRMIHLGKGRGHLKAL